MLEQKKKLEVFNLLIIERVSNKFRESHSR